jgi:hypothetical protein
VQWESICESSSLPFYNDSSYLSSSSSSCSFRQIVGRKKWWFIPPSETPYIKPSFNVNGFSAHTHTLVGKGNETESAWMKKLTRFTAVLEPGDVLINPPWFWHGILNLGTRGGGRLLCVCFDVCFSPAV